MPYPDVKFVCLAHNPKFILTSITTYLSAANVTNYLNTLAGDFPESTVLVAGAAAARLKPALRENVVVFEGAPVLKKLLQIP